MSRQLSESGQIIALLLVGFMILAISAGLAVAQGPSTPAADQQTIPTVTPPSLTSPKPTETPTHTETPTPSSTATPPPTPTDSPNGGGNNETRTGQTLVVDNDHADCPDAGFATIQSAVNSAPSGATVRVCAGTYPESVTVSTADLSISADGNTVIESTGQPGVRITASGVVFRGFTINVDQSTSKALVVGGEDTLIRDNTVSAPRGVGIFLSDGQTANGEPDPNLQSATGSRVVNNSVTAYNYRIWTDADKTVILNNNVSDQNDPTSDRRRCHYGERPTGEECESANHSIVSSGNGTIIRGNTVQYLYHTPTVYDQQGAGIQIGVSAYPAEDIQPPKHGAGHDIANQNLVVDNHVSGATDAGIRLLQVARGTVVRNNTLLQNLMGVIVWSSEIVVRNNTIQRGYAPHTGAKGILLPSNSSVTNRKVIGNTIIAYDDGVFVSGGQAEIIGNEIRNNNVHGIEFGGGHSQGGTGRVVGNKIINNTRHGIDIDSDADATEIEIHRNLINNNKGLGIANKNSSLIVDATNNFWDCGGPSSGFDPLADPYTGRLANGSGDAISAGNGSTKNGHPISNVHFDPFGVLSSCPDHRPTPTATPTSTPTPTPTPAPPGGGTGDGGGGPGTGPGTGPGSGDGTGPGSGDGGGDALSGSGDGGDGGNTANPPPTSSGTPSRTSTATPPPTSTPTTTLSPTPAVEPGFGVLTWLVGVAMLIGVLAVRRRSRGDGDCSND